MTNKNYYHGTTKACAYSILNSKKMNPSTGDRHWLGDGIYFYEEEFYAYNWLIYYYKKKLGKNYMMKKGLMKIIV